MKHAAIKDDHFYFDNIKLLLDKKDANNLNCIQTGPNNIALLCQGKWEVKSRFQLVHMDGHVQTTAHTHDLRALSRTARLKPSTANRTSINTQRGHRGRTRTRLNMAVAFLQCSSAACLTEILNI